MQLPSGARRPHSMGSTEVTTADTVMAPTAGAVLLTLRSRQRRPQSLPADGAVASDPFMENRWQSPAPQVQITYGKEEEDGRQGLRVYVALALGLPQAVPSGAAAEAPQWPAATALALGTTRPLHITLAELNLVNCSAACIAALASSLQKKVRPLTFTLAPGLTPRVYIVTEITPPFVLRDLRTAMLRSPLLANPRSRLYFPDSHLST